MTAPSDSNLDQLYLARLAKTRAAMREHDTQVMLVLDPVNILYITGASNMTLFSARIPARYLLLFAEGPCLLFDFFGCEHLARDLPTIDEIRPAGGLCFVSSGDRTVEAARKLAKEMRALVIAETGTVDTLAVGRFPYTVIDALREQGFTLTDSDAVMHAARSTKLPIELPYIREATQRVDAATGEFEAAIEPGKTEVEVWAEFHRGLIGGEGQYVTTRLMQSGANTFPYFQKCGSKALNKGDLVCLDTDSIGYEGYAVDFSRTFLCGDGGPSKQQSNLYHLAREQLEHNVDLIVQGRSYREVAAKAWPIPDDHLDSRYYCIGHGLGMSGEYPNIPHQTPDQPYPLDGHIEPDMVICIESYIGSKQSGQGVKLEQQLLVTDSGTEMLSNYHFDARLGSRM